MDQHSSLFYLFVNNESLSLTADLNVCEQGRGPFCNVSSWPHSETIDQAPKASTDKRSSLFGLSISDEGKIY